MTRSFAAFYAGMGWTTGTAYWREKAPDLRSRTVAQMADVLGVRRGRFFELLATELEEDFGAIERGVMLRGVGDQRKGA